MIYFRKTLNISPCVSNGHPLTPINYVFVEECEEIWPIEDMMRPTTVSLVQPDISSSSISSANPHPDIVIRHQPAPQKLEAGSMCLLQVLKYMPEWPQVGRIVEVDEGNKTFTIHWYAGNTTTSWQPINISVGKFRRELKETLPFCCAILYGWQLTSTAKLPNIVRQKLKEE